MNPGLILSKLIFPISTCLHLKRLSEFIPCLHSIGSMTRAPSHYDGEDAADDNMLSRLLFVWAGHHRCSPSSGWWNRAKSAILTQNEWDTLLQWSHLPCGPPPKESQMYPWRVSWSEQAGALECLQWFARALRIDLILTYDSTSYEVTFSIFKVKPVL